MSKLTRLFIDAANENVDALPKRLAELGVRYPREREAELQAALRELFYRYYGAPLSQIDPLQVIREGFDLIYSMNLELPARWLLLDKAIATLASVGVELYPEFNVFEVAKPYARDLMLRRYSPGRMALRARRETTRPRAHRAGAAVPAQRRARAGARRPDRGRLRAQGRRRLPAGDGRRVQPARGRAGRSAGLIASSLIGIFATSGPQILGINVVSVFGFVLSTILAVWLLVGVVRHGRL